MSDNTMVAIVISAMLGGCATCSVSQHRREVEIEKIRSSERLEMLKLGKDVKP